MPGALDLELLSPSSAKKRKVELEIWYTIFWPTKVKSSE